MSEKEWLVNFRPNPEARMRLFCFPYAGGSANIYRNWAGILAPDIEVVGIQLPGHGTRIKETAYTRLIPTIRALLPIIQSALDKPFALFGHSLGALLAYHLATEQSVASPPPEVLFVSASKAPKQTAANGIHTLGEAGFTNQLKGLNGTPDAVLDNQEMLDLMLPILRADFAMAETYIAKEMAELNCSIVAINGHKDLENSQKDMETWGQFTSASFENISLPGDHFFIQTQEPALLDTLERHLRTIS